MDISPFRLSRGGSGAGTRSAIALVCALAGAMPSSGRAGDKPRWELGAGATVLYLPDYRGSDESRSYVFPIPYVVYRGERLKVERERVEGLLFKSDRYELDISANATPPVRSEKNTARRGMPDLDPTIEIGPSLQVRLHENRVSGTKTTLELALRAVITVDNDPGQAGWVFNPRINADFALRNEWKLGLVAGPLFTNKRHQRYFYGVDQAYATPERRAFEPRGGYAGSQLTLALSKRFDKTWFGAFVRADNLSGASFEDSPLVKTRNNVLAGVAVAWVFSESKERVPADE